MKIFIFIIFFIFFKDNAEEIYRTFFIYEYMSIFTITDLSINLYTYTTLRKNSAVYYNFEFEEQKITSTHEENMISISYNANNTDYKQLYIIVKNYLYIFSIKYINYIKFDYLLDRYSTLVSGECVGEEEATYFCPLFISFINSENKLEIYKYKFQYNTINYSLLVSKEIDLINSSGQISINNCDYISCHKANSGSGSDVLVCFYENDNSEIAAITLNINSLELEKEIKFKKIVVQKI